MKQHFKMAALSLAVLSSTNAFAQDSSEPAYKSWFGGSAMYYNTDQSRVFNQGVADDDGVGLTVEYGFRFTQSWAARVEFTALELDYTDSAGNSADDSGCLLYTSPSPRD